MINFGAGTKFEVPRDEIEKAVLESGKPIEVLEEVRYGLLMMVLCDRWGRVYDVWISFEGHFYN